MLKRVLIASISLYLCLVTAAMGTTVYVYERPNGTRVISDHPSRDSSLTLLKRYQPRMSVESLSARYRHSSKRNLNPRTTQYDHTIFALADQYQQDRALIKAIIQIESSFNPLALSPKGAQGLMQLMPATAITYNVLRPFDVDENLRGGIAYFAHLMDRYKSDIRLALAAYNAGEGAVSKYKGVPPYPETQNYVKHVLRLHKNYQQYQPTYS